MPPGSPPRAATATGGGRCLAPRRARPGGGHALAEADAFAALGLTRREALWQARALAGDAPLPLFAGDIDGEAIDEPAAHLPPMTPGEEWSRITLRDILTRRAARRARPARLAAARKGG